MVKFPYLKHSIYTRSFKFTIHVVKSPQVEVERGMYKKKDIKLDYTHIQERIHSIRHIRGLRSDPISNIARRNTSSTFKKIQIHCKNSLENTKTDFVNGIQRRIPYEGFLTVTRNETSEHQTPQNQTLIPQLDCIDLIDNRRKFPNLRYD